MFPIFAFNFFNLLWNFFLNFRKFLSDNLDGKCTSDRENVGQDLMKFGFYNFELVNRTNVGHDRIKFGGKVYVGPC